MHRWLRTRLGSLMFLQYAMMGAWFVPFGTYMSKVRGFDGVIGLAYGSQGIATIVSVFLVGTLADRWVSSEKLLAVLFLLSAATLLAIGLVPADANLFLLLVFLHFLVFIPTIPLVNAVCFRWLPHPEAQFPATRALGTVGWIISGLAVGAISGAAESHLPLLIGGGAGLVLAGYALTLPATPPLRERRTTGFAGALGLDVIARQGDRSFWVMVAATFLIMLPMAFYYAYCNNFLSEAGATLQIADLHLEATALQSLGQVSELLFLLLLPFFLKRAGIKGVFMLGIASWVMRYALFAIAYMSASPVMWMLVAGVLLHGAANDFIQVAGQIFVNKSFDASARSRAQAFLTTVLMGAGTVAGSALANAVYNRFSHSSTHHDWTLIWAIPALAALLTLVWFSLSFRQSPTRLS